MRSTKKADPGFVAITRSLDTHPFFDRGYAYSWREAWEWLIKRAAYQPKGHRNRFGVIHTERAQVCATQRELAEMWQWSRSSVRYFLRRLVAESMVSLGKAINSPNCSPKKGYDRTLITICNYNKYQHQGKKKAHSVAQTVAQRNPELPGLIYPIATRTSKTNGVFLESYKRTGPRHRSRPRHGQLWKNLIWLATETEEWESYARDYEFVRGRPPHMIRYYDGVCGNWFAVNGEENRVALRRIK